MDEAWLSLLLSVSGAGMVTAIAAILRQGVREWRRERRMETATVNVAVGDEGAAEAFLREYVRRTSSDSSGEKGEVSGD